MTILSNILLANAIPLQQISKTAVVSLGTKPVYSKSFTISDVDAKTTSKIFMTLSPTDDGAEMDGISISAHCKTNGTLTCYAVANPGPVKGNITVSYIID